MLAYEIRVVYDLPDEFQSIIHPIHSKAYAIDALAYAKSTGLEE